MGSMVDTPRSWKGSGSGFLSELFARWPLPGPGLALPASAHHLSAHGLEFIQGNSFHFTVQKIFASHPLAGGSLRPPGSTPQAFTRTRNCIHKASPGVPTWPEPESLAAPARSCSWQNSWRTSQVGSNPHLLGDTEPLLGLDILPRLDVLILWARGKVGALRVPCIK